MLGFTRLLVTFTYENISVLKDGVVCQTSRSICYHSNERGCFELVITNQGNPFFPPFPILTPCLDVRSFQAWLLTFGNVTRTTAQKLVKQSTPLQSISFVKPLNETLAHVSIITNSMCCVICRQLVLKLKARM